MRVKHAEYSLIVLAPWVRGQCQYGFDQVFPVNCKNDGDFALKIVDDRDNVIKQYTNICSSHMLLAIISWVCGD